MSDRTFIVTLIVIATLGVVATAAHLAYIGWAYRNSSIVQFVAREP